MVSGSRSRWNKIPSQWRSRAVDVALRTVKQILWVSDHHLGIIVHISVQNMLWVFIRITSARQFIISIHILWGQNRDISTILMSSQNIRF